MPAAETKKKAGKVVGLGDLIPDPANCRRHNPRNIGSIVNSLQKVGAARSIVIDENNVILAGNGMVEAAGEAGITKVMVVEADGNTVIAVRRTGLTPKQKAELAIADNRTAELAEWDAEQLLATIAEHEIDLAGIEFTEEEIGALTAEAGGATEGDGSGDGANPAGTLAERFGVPPFTILDARQGYWQDRKRQWIALGIQSELGRGGDLIPNGGVTSKADYERESSFVQESGQTKRIPCASPGGSPRPAMKLGRDGRTRRGDGRGRELHG